MFVITLRSWQLACTPRLDSSLLSLLKKPAMSTLPGHHFEKDVHFLRLVRREPDVDLITVALEIARDAQPQLNFEPTLQKLRKSIARLTHPITQAGSDLEELKLLIRHMTEELNLRGDDDCFGEADASFVNRVIETGRGIPISLSLIYLNVANNLGIPLEPVAAPSHFLTRLMVDGGFVYIDAFNSGRIMTESECIRWLREVTERSVADIVPTMKPADERTIVIRMLRNLKQLYGAREAWRSALQVQRRLSALIPGSYAERRDLGIICLRAGYAGEAIDILERCLKTCPVEERQILQTHLRTAINEVPLSN